MIEKDLIKVTDDIYYVGVNDHEIDLFEGQYDVPNGMAYNSYIIIDEKIAIVDSVDLNFKDEWLNNVKDTLKDKLPDYLIVQHMEPDHSANILSLVEIYPDIIVVGNNKTFKMIEQFFDSKINNKLIVSEGDILSLGKHELKFVMAPMVHWPEVMMTYDIYEKVFFSADAFGKFGALDIKEDDWACEARRYYFGIVGKYGAQVQALLKKILSLDIKIICPLHGPVLNDNLGYYINLYDIWSKYEIESEGIVIAYTSIYGNTRNAVLKLAGYLEENGQKVVLNDLARCDMYEAVEDAFRYGKMVLATTTYNGDIFPKMKEFINHLIERNYSNRTIGFIENGSWAPVATRIMMDMFSKSKNICFLDSNVKIISKLNDESNKQLKLLFNELIK